MNVTTRNRAGLQGAIPSVEPSWRAIVDNDFAGDPDGLVALAHLLLSDSIRVDLVTTSALDAELVRVAGLEPDRTAARGSMLAGELASRCGRDDLPIVAGAESFGTSDAEPSPAAAAIVEQARRDDPLPLVLLCGGPLTNVAAALRLEPDLARRLVVVWVGGASDLGSAFEYNADTDRAAADVVLASGLDVWRIPSGAYRRLRVSLAEVAGDLAAASPLGGWLAERLLDVPPFVTLRGSLVLGDSSLVSLICLEPDLGPDPGRETPAPGERRPACGELDMRLLWGDLLARLRRAAT